MLGDAVDSAHHASGDDVVSRGRGVILVNLTDERVTVDKWNQPAW